MQRAVCERRTTQGSLVVSHPEARKPGVAWNWMAHRTAFVVLRSIAPNEALDDGPTICSLTVGHLL